MRNLVLLVGLAVAGWGEDGGGRVVRVGEHQMLVRCTGEPSATTVILENGLGARLDSWKAVQAGVERFARVCSYERAAGMQTPDGVVDDLHGWMEAEKIRGRYVLVGASLGGIYVRRFAARYPELTAGIVLVDSSHEEQYSHYAAISPELAERYATQDGRFDKNEFLRSAGQLEAGKRLEWHLDVPLVVLEHKRLNGAPRTEADKLAVDWHELQVDLAGRSRYGKLIETASGHMIAVEQPEAIVAAISEVLRLSRRGLRH